jgi:hypothetical protein
VLHEVQAAVLRGENPVAALFESGEVRLQIELNEGAEEGLRLKDLRGHTSEELAEAAWKRADEEGRSLSSLCREALERYIDS